MINKMEAEIIIIAFFFKLYILIKVVSSYRIIYIVFKTQIKNISNICVIFSHGTIFYKCASLCCIIWVIGTC